MDRKINRFGLSSAVLHIMAMLFMLLDHMWATVLSYDWMTCVGRLAFPIFAFMITEGFRHTGNLKKYMLRMLLFAVISEIPFNLMVGGELLYPFHQNVLWTFLIALAGLGIMEKTRRGGKVRQSILVSIAVCVLGTVLGFVLFVDYYGFGVLTVFVFYFFSPDREDNFISRLLEKSRHHKLIWTLFCFVGQFVCLYYINVELLGGLYYRIDIFGMEAEISQQGLALFALIPIWLYNGKRGYHAKWFQYFNYAFYPAHCLILALIAMFS